MLKAVFIGLIFFYQMFNTIPAWARIDSECNQNTACVRPSESLKLKLNACEIEYQSNKCQELEKNPDLKGFLKKCDYAGYCDSQNEQNENSQFLKCLVAYGEPTREMIGFVTESLDKYFAHIASDTEKRNKFIQDCTSIECKRSLVVNDPRYNKLTDQQIEKLSAAFLFVQKEDMARHMNSLERNKYTPTLSLYERAEKIEAYQKNQEKLNSKKISDKENAELKALKEMAQAQLKKLDQKWSCYNSEARLEMACYAVGNVIDPSLLVGGLSTKLTHIRKLRLAQAATETTDVAQKIKSTSRISKIANNVDLANQYLHYSPTSIAQNEKWIATASSKNIFTSKSKFLDVENSLLKTLNDTLKDKNLVTSLTNLHKDILFEKIAELEAKYPGLVIDKYSDFKSSRFALSGKVPKNIEDELQRVVSSANKEFTDIVKEKKLLTENADTNWFKAGYGETADQANISARYARKNSDDSLQSFKDTNIQTDLNQTLKNTENIRTDLKSELAQTSVMDGATLHTDAFDIVRKNIDDPEKTKQLLSQRFGLSEISDSTVQKMAAYTKKVDEFSPGLYIAKREVASLNEAVHGGLSADMVGMGATNLRHTAEALANPKDLTKTITKTRESEIRATEAFNKQREDFKNILLKSVSPGKVQSICSGDDCVAVATKALSSIEKQKILDNLAEAGYSGKFRLSFINEGIKESSARNIIAVHGESAEKQLRSILATQMEPARLKGITFGIDMQTSAVNNGTAQLMIGTAKDVKLTINEKKLIQESFNRAIQNLNADISKSSNVRANYQAK